MFHNKEYVIWNKFVAQCQSLTQWCDSMKEGPVGQGVATALCLGVCVVRNCAAGDCTIRNNKKLCKCVNCSKGPTIQYVAAVAKKGKK